MAKPEMITSAANPLLKDIRRAISRGSLTEQGWCVAETFHLLEEALRSDCEVQTVLAAETALVGAEAYARHLPVKVVMLPDALFASLAGTQTSQGVMALVKPPEWKLEQLFAPAASSFETLVVVLDGLQDPGNAGTIVRAAEAFGATGIFFLKGTVSPYNPKTLRASAGSLFRVPFLHGVDAALAREALEQNRVELFAGVPARSNEESNEESKAWSKEQSKEASNEQSQEASNEQSQERSREPVRPLTLVVLTGPCGLIVGNEAHGVSGELRSAAVEVTIPTVGVESLNAAVAAGIMLYEARRQRMLRT